MPNIVEYEARWYVVQNKGIVCLKDADGNTTDLEFREPGEFTAVLAVLQCPGDARFSAVAGERVIYSGTVRDEGPATGAHTGAPAARPPSSRAEQLRQRLDQITGTFPPARRCQDGTGSGGSSA